MAHVFGLPTVTLDPSSTQVTLGKFQGSVFALISGYLAKNESV